MHVVEFIGLQAHAARHVVVVRGEGVPQFRRPGLPLPAGLVPAAGRDAQLLQDAQRLFDLLFPGLALLGISPEGGVVVQRVVVDLMARAMHLDNLFGRQPSWPAKHARHDAEAPFQCVFFEDRECLRVMSAGPVVELQHHDSLAVVALGRCVTPWGYFWLGCGDDGDQRERHE